MAISERLRADFQKTIDGWRDRDVASEESLLFGVLEADIKDLRPDAQVFIVRNFAIFVVRPAMVEGELTARQAITEYQETITLLTQGMIFDAINLTYGPLDPRNPTFAGPISDLPELSSTAIASSLGRFARTISDAFPQFWAE